MSKPYQFPNIPSALTHSTQLYTQMLDENGQPQEYKFTLLELLTFLNSNFSVSGSKPLRFTYNKISGSTFTVNLPTGVVFPNNDDIYVYVEGRGLMEWGNGISRTGNTFSVAWALDQESVQVVIHI